MHFYVDPNSGVPIFRQLMDQVKLQIASGTLRPGDELPSIRSLSIPLGVNPMTISKAYNLLVHDQVLERRPGRPLVVAELDESDLDTRRIERLQEILRPAVELVRQLDLDAEVAVVLLRDMLAGNETGFGSDRIEED